MNEQIKAGADIHAGDGGYSEGTQEQYDAFVKVRNKSLAQGRIKELADPDPYSDIELSEEYDAYYSISKNEWIDSKCDDPTCEFCSERPERPLP